MANEYTNLINRINQVVRSEKFMRTALTTVLATHKSRIFEKGLDASGAQIGTYSTKPISISRRQQARQTGQTFFPGGYSEYKTAIGRNPGKVILRNTDQMYGDYGLIVSGNSFGFGFQNGVNFDKSQWMQDKYDKDIFDLSKQEEGILLNTLQAQLNKI